MSPPSAPVAADEGWHLMAMSTGQSGPELNVTPLIDVLLVLLVIFMIIANQMKPTGEPALIPQSPSPGAPETQDPRVIVIQLSGASGTQPAIKINNQSVAWEALHDTLMEIYARRMEKVAFIQADRDVDFEYIADVIDTAHQVEIDKVGLMPSKP